MISAYGRWFEAAQGLSLMQFPHFTLLYRFIRHCAALGRSM
jgi:hypothetical protein